MANKEIIGGIIEKTLNEIIEEKGFSGEEYEVLLKKSLQLVALAMAGHVLVSSPEDTRKIKGVIEG
jgi:hypothetical protein